MLLLPILISGLNAFCPCPVCPLIAASIVGSAAPIAGVGMAAAEVSAAEGAALSATAMAAIGVYAVSSVPFALAIADTMRDRNLTFEMPSKDQFYQSGENVTLFMKTKGLASRMRIRSVDVYLLNSTFGRVMKIATKKEFDVLKDIHYKYLGVVPANGTGQFNWVIPQVPTGRYYLKYVSGWTIWRHQGIFESLSPSFLIKNDESEIPDSPDVHSFTHDTAPAELHFMYDDHWIPFSDSIHHYWETLTTKVSK